MSGGDGDAGRVALIEHDPVVRGQLTRSLVDHGFEVREFADGGEALLALWEGVAPDVVLSTVELPRLDGVSLCAALRERFRRERVRIVLVSSCPDEQQRARALHAGADDYLARPLSTEALLARLFDVVSVGPDVRTDHLHLDPQPPAWFERYELRSIAGRGTYGTVYRARAVDGVEVAVKLLTRDVNQDTRLLARFLREISSLSQVSSPHVVRVLRSGFERGRYFIVLELVEGASLYDVLRCRGQLSTREAMRIGRDLCAAVEALQEVQLVHRDIKPANILVGPTGAATLLDFGLAKQLCDRSVTSTGELVGTVAYFAPEVIVGEPQHVGSDLYAIGVTLWELLVGTRPFVGKTAIEVMDAIASGVPAPRVASVRPDVPEALSDLIASLTEPDSVERLSDPAVARGRFEALLEAEGAALTEAAPGSARAAPALARSGSRSPASAR